MGKTTHFPDEIARIKEMRAEGYKLHEIAEALGITIHHLKYVMYVKYSKTDFVKLTIEQKLERRYREEI